MNAHAHKQARITDPNKKLEEVMLMTTTETEQQSIVQW